MITASGYRFRSLHVTWSFFGGTTMDDQPPSSETHLTWANVGIGFSFILFDSIISSVFGLGVGTALITAAVRCVVQLAVVALLLQKVFEAENPWAVGGIAGM